MASENEQVESVRAAVERGEEDNLALLSARLVLSSVSLSRLKAFYNAQLALGALENATYLTMTSADAARSVPETDTHAKGVEGR